MPLLLPLQGLLLDSDNSYKHTRVELSVSHFVTTNFKMMEYDQYSNIKS